MAKAKERKSIRACRFLKAAGEEKAGEEALQEMLSQMSERTRARAARYCIEQKLIMPLEILLDGSARVSGVCPNTLVKVNINRRDMMWPLIDLAIWERFTKAYWACRRRGGRPGLIFHHPNSREEEGMCLDIHNYFGIQRAA